MENIALFCNLRKRNIRNVIFILTIILEPLLIDYYIQKFRLQAISNFYISGLNPCEIGL